MSDSTLLAQPVRPKTFIRGTGKLRKRWKDAEGNIYEWDYQHGSVEKYDRGGRHLGEFHPETAIILKFADPNRRIEP